MKIACQEGMVRGKDLKEKLGKLEEFGYEGIELAGRRLLEDEDWAKEVIKATKKSAVRPSTICAGYRGCPLGADREERDMAIGDIKRLLEIGGEIGLEGGLIFVPIFGPPRVPDLSPYKTALELEEELLLEVMSELAGHAERSGCVLLLEPLNRYETHLVKTLSYAASLVRRVNSPGLRMMADFFHMNIEEADIAGSIREAGDLIRHVHLADSNRVLPGYGHTDFVPGFRALKELGYDKYMALECGIPGDPDVELPKAAEYLKGLIANL